MVYLKHEHQLKSLSIILIHYIFQKIKKLIETKYNY